MGLINWIFDSTSRAGSNARLTKRRRCAASWRHCARHTAGSTRAGLERAIGELALAAKTLQAAGDAEGRVHRRRVPRHGARDRLEDGVADGRAPIL